MRDLFVIYVLILVFFVISPSAHARERCENLLIPGFNADAIVSIAQTPLTKKRTEYKLDFQIPSGQIRHVTLINILGFDEPEVTYEQVQETLGSYVSLAHLCETAGIEVPENMVLKLQYQNFSDKLFGRNIVSGAQFNHSDASVEISYHYFPSGREEQRRRSRKHSLVVQIHEIAHAILDHHLMKSVPAFKNFKTLFTRQQKLLRLRKRSLKEETQIIETSLSQRQHEWWETKFQWSDNQEELVREMSKEFAERHLTGLEPGVLKKTRRQVRAAQEIFAQAQDDEYRYLKRNMRPNRFAKYIQVQKQLAVVDTELADISEKIEAFLGAFDMYHEFWADLVPSVFFEDSAAAGKAIAKSKDDHALGLRRFNNKTELNDIPDEAGIPAAHTFFLYNRFGRSVYSHRVNYGGPGSRSPHITLRAAKNHLYKKYWLNPQVAKNRAVILRPVLNALTNEIITNLNAKDEAPLTLRGYNARLMETLDRELSSPFDGLSSYTRRQ